MLEAGADKDVTTALCAAVQRGHLGVVQLLQASADKDATVDDSGSNAAAESGHLKKLCASGSCALEKEAMQLKETDKSHKSVSQLFKDN